MMTLAHAFLRRLRNAPRRVGLWLRKLGLWCRKDWPMKLGSLVLATLAFFVLQLFSPNVDSRVIRIPVEPDSLVGSTMTIADVTATEVKVTLRGRLDLLLSVKPEDLRLRVGSIPKPGEKEKHVKLTSKRIERIDGAYRAFPDGVRVVSIDPDDITLTFEEQCTHTFAIEPPAIHGKPLIGEVRTDAVEILGKRMIKVTGPANILQPLYDNSIRIGTTPVDVSQSSRTFDETVDLIPPTAIRPYISDEDMKVRVRIPINVETSEKPFPEIPVNVAAVTDGEHLFTCSSPHVAVVVSGNKSTVAKVTASDIVALVSGNDIGDEDGDSSTVRPVRVFFRDQDLYSSLRIHDPDPAFVTVTVRQIDPTVPAPGDPNPDVLFTPPEDAAGAAPEPAGTAIPAEGAAAVPAVVPAP